jgi:hypothetical protein
MDQLAELGTEISRVLSRTFELYVPLLLKQADSIKSTKRESFSYGKFQRQRLDVYTPSTPTSADKKVLIYLYGGGMVRGDKILPNIPEGLVYANIGHFLAERLGCKVVIPDYRLISHGAKFPSGGDDVALTIQWVQDNIANHAAKPLDLFLMGNSAGGIHVSTYLFAEDFASSRQEMLGQAATRLKLQAAVLVSVPFHFQQALPSREEMLHEYYGNDIAGRCPFGLMKAAKTSGALSAMKEVSFLTLTGTLDPQDEIVVPNEDFVKEWTGDNLMTRSMQGHNHISPFMSLGTGIKREEEWGEQVVTFLTEVATGSG